MEEPHNKSIKKPKKVDTLAAALGLKGSLRIVPQGVTRKPHIVLKRVDDDDDFAAAGSSKRVARFAFSTAKRIQLKPDADLIFALEAPDGEGLLLEGDIDSGTDSEAEESEHQQQPVKRNEVTTTADQTKIGRLPPKMRKCLQKTSAFNDYYHYGPEKNFGFPGYPMSVELPRVYSDATVQTEMPSPSTHSPPKAHPLPSSTLPRYLSPSYNAVTSKSPLQLPSPVSADHAREQPIIDGTTGGAEHEEVDDESSSRVERSLSPMDFSSVESSPQCSPPAELPQEKNVALPSVSSQTETSSHITPIEKDSLLFSAPKDFEMLDVPPQQGDGPPVTTPAEVPPLVSETEPSLISSSEDAAPPEASQDSAEGQKAITPPKIGFEPNEAPQTSVARQAATAFERIPADNLGKPPPIGPRAMREQLSSKVYSSATTPASTIPMPISTRRVPQSTVETDRPSSPAPDPRTVAYIPHGTTTNPLGIRPSQVFKPPTGPRALVANTLATAAVSTVPKKPVVVGSGWTAVRNPLTTSSSVSSSSKAGAASSVFQTPSASSSSNSPAPTTHSQPKAANRSAGAEAGRKNLSLMLSYSPSPEPPDNSQRTAGWSGWKPLSPKGSSSTNEPSASETAERERSPSLKRMWDDTASWASPATNSSDIQKEKEADGTGYTTKRARLEDRDQLGPLSHKTTHRRNPSAQVVLTTPRPPQRAAPIPTPPGTGKVKTLPPQLIHPLPAKPLLAINGGPVLAGSSYRPGRDSRDRDRDRDERDDFSMSRRKRVHDREHDDYADRGRDRSASAGPSAKGGAGLSASARVGRSSVGASTSTTGTQWPATTTSTISVLEGQADGDLGVLQVAVSSDGVHVALICADRSVRVWTTKQPATEVARLYNSTMPACIIWDSRDAGIVTLCQDGVVGSWMKKNASYREWQFAKWFTVNEALDTSTTLFLAYWKDRIAVSTPSGVKLWILTSGQWKSQRDIVRSGVTAIRFVRDGEVLMGGCKDGVMWCCEVPNGTLRVHMFLPNGKAITSIEAHPSGSNLLVTQEGGLSHLVTFRATENKGSIEKTYTSERLQVLASNKNSAERRLSAVFATRGQAVLFGVVNSCTLIWDRKKGVIVYGLKHEEDDPILAAATFDGRPSANMDGWMITGTKQGMLYWWPQPVAAASNSEDRKKTTTTS